MALSAAHLNAGVILAVTAYRYIAIGLHHLPLPLTLTQSSGAVWRSRWPPWAPRPNEPYGFCGRKATLNHVHTLVSLSPIRQLDIQGHKLHINIMPWHNRNGWLDFKHQITHSCFTCTETVWSMKDRRVGQGMRNQAHLPGFPHSSCDLSEIFQVENVPFLIAYPVNWISRAIMTVPHAPKIKEKQQDK